MANATVNFLRSEGMNLSKRIDLNRELVNHPISTFFFRAGQKIESNPAINKGDVLIVDRSWNLAQGNKVIFSTEDNLYFGQMHKEHGKLYVKRGDKTIPVTDGVEIWGAVTYVIHKA